MISNNKIDEKIVNIKINSTKNQKENSSNKIVIKSNKSKTSISDKNDNNNNNKIKSRIIDGSTQTLVDEIECYEESVQTKIRKEKETQTEFREILHKEDKNYDEKRMQFFLEKSLVLIEEVLNAREEEAFEFYDDEQPDYEYSHSNNMRMPLITNDLPKRSKISDICWSANGRILAVAYYIDDHIGPCAHQMLINFFEFEDLNKDRYSKNKIVLDANSCIKAIEPHPLKANVFAACTYLGEILLINLNNKDQIQYSSKIDSYFHKELVTNIKWIDLYKDGNYCIASISDEGRLLIWSVDDKLDFPVIGFSLKIKMGKNTIPIHPASLAENYFDPCEFLVGTVDGNIYKASFTKPSDNNFNYIFNDNSGIVWRRSIKLLISNMNDKDVLEIKNYIEKFCKDKNIVDLNSDEFFKLKPDVNKLYKNCLKSNFEKHASVVFSIQFNPFIKNLFASCSFDGSLRIYYQGLLSGSKYVLSSNLVNEHFSCLSWSIFRCDILAAGTSNGKLIMYSVSDKRLITLLEIDRKLENSMINIPINKISFNPIYRNILTVSYEDGIVEMIYLSEDFYTNSHNDIERLKADLMKLGNLK